MSELVHKRCLACEGGVRPLSAEQAQTLLQQLKGWQLQADNKKLVRTFNFNNYYETMAFVNAIAWFSHQENHHADLEVSYNRCVVNYMTHAIGGLSENDFICAAKVDALLPD